ncbi:uncharacterized protein LOC126570808, partial [Anopheles aquasalis]|uniref:uncharacterized protein LOC126570808 n=1 Tax=Anopheles aquasalis TaxID=42839 RepID=UPI00215AD86C
LCDKWCKLAVAYYKGQDIATPEVAHFGSTQRGKPLLVIGGYSFIRNGEFIDSINWRCSLHRTLKCKAKAITIKRDGQKSVRLSYPEHNHAPNAKFTDCTAMKRINWHTSIGLGLLEDEIRKELNDNLE